MKLEDLPDLPAVPVLRKALVAWATGDGSQQNLPAAQIARRLCSQRCFFCGSQDGAVDQDGPWQEVIVCSCLPLEVGDWDKNPGYREVLSQWEARQAELLAAFKRRHLSGEQPVYQNKCLSCSGAFEVTVRTVANSILRHGHHAVMNRCKSCKFQGKGRRPQNKKSEEEGFNGFAALATALREDDDPESGVA